VFPKCQHGLFEVCDEPVEFGTGIDLGNSIWCRKVLKTPLPMLIYDGE